MKNINYKTNKPLFLGILANSINFTLMQTEFFHDGLGLLMKGVVTGFSLVAIMIGLRNMNHETCICKWKKNLYAKLWGNRK